MTSQPVLGKAGAVGALLKDLRLRIVGKPKGLQKLCSPRRHFSD